MIEAKGLTKRYGRTVAVNNLSFAVQPGKVTGFLGPNGAGKSTTMRMALGLDHPSGGDVRINGRHFRDLKRPLHTVGALLDAKWVHPNRSAKAHLSWLAVSNGIPRRRVGEVLALVGLSEVANKRAGGFSLGMSQRLGIAAALLGDPEVLMFDEPVNGLDPEGIVWIRNLMQSLAAQGRTIFVSSHLLSEMAITATELVVIGRGQLITQCSTADFIEGATEAMVRVRSPQAEQLEAALTEHGANVTRQPDGALQIRGKTSEEIGELAAAQQLILHELTPQRGSLEEAFMQITGHSVEFSAGRPDAGAPVPVGPDGYPLQGAPGQVPPGWPPGPPPRGPVPSGAVPTGPPPGWQQPPGWPQQLPPPVEQQHGNQQWGGQR